MSEKVKPKQPSKHTLAKRARLNRETRASCAFEEQRLLLRACSTIYAIVK